MFKKHYDNHDGSKASPRRTAHFRLSISGIASLLHHSSKEYLMILLSSVQHAPASRRYLRLSQQHERSSRGRFTIQYSTYQTTHIHTVPTYLPTHTHYKTTPPPKPRFPSLDDTNSFLPSSHNEAVSAAPKRKERETSRKPQTPNPQSRRPRPVCGVLEMCVLLYLPRYLLYSTVQYSTISRAREFVVVADELSSRPPTALGERRGRIQSVAAAI